MSEDILNRSLPIHLTPVGNIQDRQSPIGNPKHEFLPRYREQIAAELRGMIEHWKSKGSRPDMNVRHPFALWAQTVGGILKVNGFQSFLENYGKRKSIDDPVREGLGILGAARPDQWLRTAEWVNLAEHLGLVGRLIPPGDRETGTSKERGLGAVLSKHELETLIGQSDDGVLTLRLEKARRRWKPGEQPHTRYRFAIVNWHPTPVDDAEPQLPETPIAVNR